MNRDNRMVHAGQSVTRAELHNITPAQLRNAGLGEVGYIKEILQHGEAVYFACAADGSRLSAHDSHDEAHVALRNDYNLGVIPLQ